MVLAAFTAFFTPCLALVLAFALVLVLAFARFFAEDLFAEDLFAEDLAPARAEVLRVFFALFLPAFFEAFLAVFFGRVATTNSLNSIECDRSRLRRRRTVIV